MLNSLVLISAPLKTRGLNTQTLKFNPWQKLKKQPTCQTPILKN